MTGSLEVVIAAIKGWLENSHWPLVVGICGAQGSGKSTLSADLAQYFSERGVALTVLSLDDLYLAPDLRPVAVSPLFATRGVPGTHDVQLGIDVIEAMANDKPVALPHFDKATDAPLPRQDWPLHEFPSDIIILEGWCVGAVPQTEAELIAPVNELERDHDPEGVWRAYANAQLAGPYQALFSRIDRLVFLAAPDFSVVQGWRTEQEHALAARLATEGRTGTHVMTDAEVAAFIQYYERLTQHILAEMPGRADMTLRLDARRRLMPA